MSRFPGLEVKDSFKRTMDTIRPALDRVMGRRPPAHTSGLSVGTITSNSEQATYIAVHTAVYNSMTSSRRTMHIPSELHLYILLDEYFAEVAREQLRAFLQDPSTSTDDAAFATSFLNRFEKYRNGAARASRMLDYINRLYVRREVDEGRGWARALEVVDKEVVERARRKGGNVINDAEVKSRFYAWKEREIRRWGFDQQALAKQSESAEDIARKKNAAEQRAEAGSKLGAVVPIKSMALRRFRVEVVEPLLGYEGAVGEDVPRGDSQDKLARLIERVVDESEGAEKDRAEGLLHVLRDVGIAPEDASLIRLEEYVAK